MFTGLIEEVGEIVALEHDEKNLHLSIRASKVLEDIDVDDSIAVDGCCQTVVRHEGESFSVTAIDETLKKTTFGLYQIGDKVNLERALQVRDRLGGHIVQGHVDCVGSIRSIRENEGSWMYEIEYPEEHRGLVIPVGSVAINGVSLTVAQSEAECFTVAIIPHTHSVTTFSLLKENDSVNLEFDMVGKYIRGFVQPHIS